jgi:hypothetical protein
MTSMLFKSDPATAIPSGPVAGGVQMTALLATLLIHGVIGRRSDRGRRGDWLPASRNGSYEAG